MGSYQTKVSTLRDHVSRSRLPCVLIVILLLLAGCADEGEVPSQDIAPTEVVVPTVEVFVPTPEVSEPTAAGEEEAPEVALETDGPRADERTEMVEEGIMALGIEKEPVIEAMLAVPRHAFVPDDYQSEAYANHPLPIGFGQTISQPFIVALMTEAAEVEAGDKVLEVGTGSGYQAAVLAEIVDEVYSVEIIEPLAERAEATLQDLGYDNVTVRHADGYFGWEEQAPFDAILVTAAPDHVPQPLVEQLKEGAHMIIPVGPVGGFQTLWRVTRTDEGVQTENLGSVMFVPLTREDSEE